MQSMTCHGIPENYVISNSAPDLTISEAADIWEKELWFKHDSMITINKIYSLTSAVDVKRLIYNVPVDGLWSKAGYHKREYGPRLQTFRTPTLRMTWKLQRSTAMATLLFASSTTTGPEVRPENVSYEEVATKSTEVSQNSQSAFF